MGKADKANDEKNQTTNSEEVPKRKRGRPRKTGNTGSDEKKKKTKKTSSKNAQLDMPVNEEIILELPISRDEIMEYENQSGSISTTSKKQKNVFETIPGNMTDSVILTLSDISDDSTGSDGSDGSNSSVKELQNLVKAKDRVIKKLKEDLNKLQSKNNSSSYQDSGLDTKKVSSVDLNLVTAEDGKTIVTKKTDIACWWCAHQFDNMPCFIPDRHYEDKFFVFGCFCSYNCAAAYNINMNDYKVWDRHSLIKVLFNLVFENEEDIVIAPPREVLKMFGGPLTIEEFRNSSKKRSKEYRLIMPPMVSIVSQLEESSVTNNYSISSSRYNPNSDIGSSGYRLERSKPLPNIHTNIFESMDLRKKSKKKNG